MNGLANRVLGRTETVYVQLKASGRLIPVEIAAGLFEKAVMSKRLHVEHVDEDVNWRIYERAMANLLDAVLDSPKLLGSTSRHISRVMGVARVSYSITPSEVDQEQLMAELRIGAELPYYTRVDRELIFRGGQPAIKRKWRRHLMELLGFQSAPVRVYYEDEYITTVDLFPPVPGLEEEASENDIDDNGVTLIDEDE